MPAGMNNDEMREWVAEFGSSRLRKALATGFLDVSDGVYKQERLKKDRPNWRFLALEKLNNNELRKTFVDIHAPSESALDAYIDATERYAEEDWPVNLMHWYEGDQKTELLVQVFLGRKAGIDVPDYHRWLGAVSQTAQTVPA